MTSILQSTSHEYPGKSLLKPISFTLMDVNTDIMLHEVERCAGDRARSHSACLELKYTMHAGTKLGFYDYRKLCYTLPCISAF